MKNQNLSYPDGWYIVANSKEFSQKKPKALKRFGMNLVGWRNKDGQALVMADRCPHRSVKLSAGKIVDNCIECPFHGFRFNSDGACKLVPEIQGAAPGLKVTLFKVIEQNHFIWIWYSETGQPALGTPQWFDEISPRASFATIQETVQCHVTRAIENQLDYAHLRFVHSNTIGRMASESFRHPTLDLGEEHIKFVFGEENTKNEAFIFYKKPNIWLNAIGSKFMIFLAFCPIDENSTLIYMRPYQSFLTIPFIGNMVTRLINISNRYILREDSSVVKTHPAGSSLESGQSEVLFKSDKPIQHFRKIWF